ncbi:hypothetical protein ASF02_13275 [Pseudomonas sp. Leaf58]|nr:hypothetical protein ASF02_13275 [Pseudomonas sp. Leaf58]
MVFWNIVTNSYLQVKSFTYDIHYPVKHIKLNFEVRICTRQFSNRWSHIIPAKTEAATDVQ